MVINRPPELYLPGRQVAELCACSLRCHTAPWPDLPVKVEITISGVLSVLLTFFSSASCSSVNACSPEFSYQNLCPNQTMPNGVNLNGSDLSWVYLSPVLSLWNWSPTKQRKVGPRMPWSIFYVIILQFWKNRTSSADSSSPPTKRSTSSTLSYIACSLGTMF